MEDRRGHGYFSWRMDTLDLVELYGSGRAAVGAALQAWGQGPATERPDPSLDIELAQIEAGISPQEATAAMTDILCAYIMNLGGGQALSACQVRLSDRLGLRVGSSALVLEDASETICWR